MTRQVGARDRLMRSDQIENDAPVDIARRFAGSDLKIREIDSSHSGAPFVTATQLALFFSFLVSSWPAI